MLRATKKRGSAGAGDTGELRQYGTLTEIHERAQVIALMRVYGRRWRSWPACEAPVAAAQAREEGFAVTPDVTRTEGG
jgi:methyl coenzyme M reductase subunit C